MQETATTESETKPGDRDRCPGEDALCFMAGPQGAYFGAGVVHAYLAADRTAPVVVAGISAGSLTAAAMYKAYSELQKAEYQPEGMREAARWGWYRSYLECITKEPLSPIWDALPNPGDFFADTIPVEDTSCPQELKKEETEARRQFHRLLRLGNWLGGLSVSVADIADTLVRHVRWSERYAVPYYQRALFFARVVWISWQVTFHVAADPRISWFSLTYDGDKIRTFFRPMPIMGWRLWFLSAGWVAAAAAVPAYVLYSERWWWILAVLAVALIPGIFIKYVLFTHPSWWLLTPLGLRKGLLRKYPMKRWLLRLFGETRIHAPSKGPFHLLVVAAALNSFEGEAKGTDNAQLWARPGVRLRDALASSLSVPTLFAPESVDPHDWMETLPKSVPDPLVLVDGAVIRTNPLPALFNWLQQHRKDKDQEAAIQKLFHTPENPGASLRIVYSVPIEPLPLDQEKKRESIDVVESARISLRLQRQRDTEMESKQTEFISGLESEIRNLHSSGGDAKEARFPIFPLPISPENALRFDNLLDPTREEGLLQTAHGCRRTLEAIYRDRLSKFGGAKVACKKLLAEVAPARGKSVLEDAPGLSEVCGACQKACGQMLTVRPQERSSVEKQAPSFGLPDPATLHERFPRLIGDKPRIAFIANGGVFRGSFHVGVAAGLRLAGVKPDLIVGSSVGAIIGAALCVLSRKEDEKEAGEYVCQLAEVFLKCDEKVGLTRRLKSVAKELGVRGRAIHISPRLLRKRILQGSRADSAYAITGAPPVLIDAIADLFLIPHRKTQDIAATFVSGKIAEASKLFFKAVQEETLRRLEIENSVMGADLLEDTTRKLIFPQDHGTEEMDSQPFLPQTAFFATSTLLSRHATILLGRDYPDEVQSPEQVNFLETCLASSAFPVVFTPRSAAQVIPGRGRTDALLCDGGIFDNLPFFPTIEVLSAVQTSYATATGAAPAKYLKTRQAAPVLMIAAGLDGGPPEKRDVPDDVIGLRGLASSLNAHVKLESFERSAQTVYKMTERFLNAHDKRPGEVNAGFFDRLVPAAVLKILPADAQHLNGTFAFCRSLGLESGKMRTSIAHGCFQTLHSLAHAGAEADTDVLRASLRACTTGNRLTPVSPRSGETVGPNMCPYFKTNGNEVQCPFTFVKEPAVLAIYQTCRKDKLHQQQAARPKR